ncbi:MAG: hypothetical protein QXD38_06520 [Ignisphaera sp.]
MECRKCGSKNIDVFRLKLPESLPMAVVVTIPKSIRNELTKLLENYDTFEMYICRDCGYTELRFVRRGLKPSDKDADRGFSTSNLL